MTDRDNDRDDSQSQSINNLDKDQQSSENLGFETPRSPRRVNNFDNANLSDSDNENQDSIDNSQSNSQSSIQSSIENSKNENIDVESNMTELKQIKSKKSNNQNENDDSSSSSTIEIDLDNENDNNNDNDDDNDDNDDEPKPSLKQRFQKAARKAATVVGDDDNDNDCDKNHRFAGLVETAMHAKKARERKPEKSLYNKISSCCWLVTMIAIPLAMIVIFIVALSKRQPISISTLNIDCLVSFNKSNVLFSGGNETAVVMPSLIISSINVDRYVN
jgi:hypothetical protein